MRNIAAFAFRHALAATFLVLFAGAPLLAQRRAEFAAQVSKIISKPLYRHATFGIEVYSLDTGKVVYAKNAQQLFTPASTTKLLTEGTALELLGPDFRFHTRVYRTGPVSADGTLHGDLILVGSGDPNLSGRIRPNGTLAWENWDHTYGGSRYTRAVPGDPLLVIHELAKKIAAAGIKRIDGQVLVDATLFPEGEAELGTGAIISPVVVNDNLIDVTVTPGAHPGDPVNVHVSPQSAYAQFINQATTGAPGSKNTLDWGPDKVQPNGSHVVTIIGSFPADSPSILYSYDVPQPSRFAEMTLVQALQQEGVQANFSPYSATPDFEALAADYTPANVVAEHVSPPFAQDVKVTLKVSQNLHASLVPYLLGAILAHAHQHVAQAGFNLEHAFLAKAGLDLSGASQSDGAGGAEAAFFTPDFMCHYLAYMAKQKNFPIFENALPILGKDGTLFNIGVHSPAAGHVFAKTGTYMAMDRLNDNLMVTGKGLAGYLVAKNGRRYSFALYANRVSLPLGGLDSIETVVGGTLGQIAAAIYEVGP